MHVEGIGRRNGFCHNGYECNGVFEVRLVQDIESQLWIPWHSYVVKLDFPLVARSDQVVNILEWHSKLLVQFSNKKGVVVSDIFVGR